MGSKSAVLRMHHDRWWEFGAADTQHSKFVNSAATAEWEGERKERWLQGLGDSLCWRQDHLSLMMGMFRQVP